jgi:hypothetical protein
LLTSGTVLKCRHDDLQYAFEVLQHLVVPEPQDPIASALEEMGPSGINLAIVLTAVDLDDQPCFDAQEVHHEGLDRRLKPELVPDESAVAQRTPEQALGVGRSPTEARSMTTRLAT